MKSALSCSGVPTAYRVCAHKFEKFGGGLGGGLPLGVLALLFATNNPDMVTFASPFAYFVVFGVFGAFIGAVTGPATVSLVRALRLPLPLRGK